MFQYIALSWDVTSELRSAAARGLSNALSAREGWGCALRVPGLHVFTAGARPGVNSGYALNRGIVLGRLFRRRDLASQPSEINLMREEIDRIEQTTGKALVDEFWGRYVAFLPARAHGYHVLRDPSGALPCYRLQHDGVWLTFSWLEGMLEALPAVPPPRVSWDGVTAQLLLGRWGGYSTALEQVLHVPPGELAPVDTAGDRVDGSVWNAVDFARQPLDATPEAAADVLRQTVRQCVLSWAGCYEDILLRLSGGLDSAILLSCLRPCATPSRVTCLNYHSPGSDSDERPYARSVADHMGMPMVERACDPGYPLEEVLDVALTPTPESYVGRMSMAHIDAETAAAFGAQAMFTGGGGDQLFFEHRCTHPAADYLRTRGLDGGFPRAVQDAARLGHVSVWAAASRAMAHVVRRSVAGEPPLSRPALASDELSLGQTDRFLHPSLALAGDLSVGKAQQVQQLLSPFGYYDPYLRERAPELVNPLLSQPLIELCLALPTYLLTVGGRGRALARRAFAGDLPPLITNRRSKGGMEEHLGAVLQRNLAFARDLLLEGQLVARRMLDRSRLETALSNRPSNLEAYVSEIHGYIALEAWLNRCATLRQGRAD